jgi:hypothetical protein
VLLHSCPHLHQLRYVVSLLQDYTATSRSSNTAIFKLIILFVLWLLNILGYFFYRLRVAHLVTLVPSYGGMECLTGGYMPSPIYIVMLVFSRELCQLFPDVIFCFPQYAVPIINEIIILPIKLVRLADRACFRSLTRLEKAPNPQIVGCRLISSIEWLLNAGCKPLSNPRKPFYDNKRHLPGAFYT